MSSSQSINLFVGVILCHISPKAFPKECCYYGAYQWSKFSPILSAREVFISSFISSKQLFSLVAEFHLKFWDVFHKPSTSLFFSLLIFQQLRYNLLGRVLSKLICGRSCHFLLHSLFQGSIFYYLFLPEAWWCCSLHSSSRFVRTVFFSCLSISNWSVMPSFQVHPILSSFASLLNRSAVWYLSDPLCHSFNSSGGSVLLISLSILSSCKVHVQFLPFTVGVLSILYHSYSFFILF